MGCEWMEVDQNSRERDKKERRERTNEKTDRRADRQQTQTAPAAHFAVRPKRIEKGKETFVRVIDKETRFGFGIEQKLRFMNLDMTSLSQSVRLSD